jgi:tetratricopeptide (TPR) repeat protein
LRTSSSQPLHDTIDHQKLLQHEQQQEHDDDNNDSFSFLSSSFDAFSAASAVASAISSSSSSSSMRKHDHQDDDIDTIEPLINKRKALLRSKQFSFSKNKRGVLGFDIDNHNQKTYNHDDDGEDENDNDYYHDYDDDDDDEEENLFLSAPPTQDYLNGLTKTFHQSKNVEDPEISELNVHAMNNYQLKELYVEAKHADQNGDIQLSKALLNKLYQVTPHDTRVIRRLARLEIQDKNYDKGREILQTGLRALPDDVHLLHGLGQLERSCGNWNKAREFFKEAIQACPTIPNPYHALGTLEHSQGNIRVATTVLRMGLKLCPSNHRLHHALGDLYREAKMLDMAEKAYLRGLKCLDSESATDGKQLNWSRSFFYTGMSYLSYDRGDLKTCRRWLKKGIDHSHNKMHSQGWLGLAQLEESEGNIDETRRIYHEGLNIYEKHRGINKVKSPSRTILGGGRSDRVRPPKLGDKWLEVYESSIRLEEKYGDYNSVNNVYSQAATAFPSNWNILASWARFQRRHGNFDRARTLFELACRRAGNR